MHRGRARSRREALVQQAALVWAEAKSDELQHFIETGNFGKRCERMPYNPAVAAKIAEIHANGGKLIITPE